jgi:hypothetical protein
VPVEHLGVAAHGWSGFCSLSEQNPTTPECGGGPVQVPLAASAAHSCPDPGGGEVLCLIGEIRCLEPLAP